MTTEKKKLSQREVGKILKESYIEMVMKLNGLDRKQAVQEWTKGKRENW